MRYHVPTPTERLYMDLIATNRARLAAAEQDKNDARVDRLNRQRWALLREWLEACPFEVSTELDRREQWRRVRDHFGRTVADPDLCEMARTQMEIAYNKTRGIRDLRPFPTDTCYIATVRFVTGRLRKAEAILIWDEGAAEQRPSEVLATAAQTP